MAKNWEKYISQISEEVSFEDEAKETIEKLSSLESKRKNVVKNSEVFSNQWNDTTSSNRYLKEVQSYYDDVGEILTTLKSNEPNYKKYIGQKNYNELIKSLKEQAKQREDIVSKYSNTVNLYSKYKSADEYNTAVKNQGYSQKYKGYTYKQISDLLSSDSYNVQRRRGLIDEAEAKWLKNQMYALATSAEIQQEIEALGGENKWQTQKNSAEKQRVMTEGEKRRAIKNGTFNATLESSTESQKEAQANLDKISLLETILAQKKKQEEFNKKWADEFEKFKQDGKPNSNDLKRFETLAAVTKDDEYLKYLSDDEKSFAASLAEKKSDKVALEYYNDLIGIRLDAQYNQDLMQGAYDFSADGLLGGVGGSLASVGTSLASGVEYAGNLLSGKTDRRVRTATLTQGFREGTKSQWDSEFWDFIYDTGMSGVDSIAAAGISAMAPYLGEILLGGSAAASTFNDALDRGVTGGDAILSSVAAGVAESLFEHVSIGNLSSLKPSSFAGLGFTKAGIKKAATEIGKQMLVNATEETLTEIANVVSDQLINGELSSYAIAVKDYYMQGMTPDEAKKKAAEDVGKQVLLAGASGLLMGFGFGTGGSVVGLSSSQIKNSKNGNTIISNGNVETLKILAVDSDIKNIVKDSEKLTEKSKPSEVGSVYNRLVENAVESSVKQMTPILLENGAKEGGSNSAKARALQIAQSVLKKKDSNVANLMRNRVTSDVYTAFAKEGKYGGDMLLALKELASNPQPKAMTANDFVNSYGGEGPAVSGEIKGVASAPRTGTIHPITEAFGKSVAENLERQRPTPQRPKTKKITKTGEAVVKAIGKAMGVEVEFTESAVDGVADGKTVDHKKVYISRYTVDPIKEVIKHEFTHTTEISKHYGKFQKYLFDESEAFKVWLKSKGYTKWTEMETDIIDLYKQNGETLDHEGAKAEIVAKFVSENLFKDSGTEVTETFLKELYLKDRNLFDRFVDWVKSVFARLKASGAVNKDIIKLEQKFIRLAETAKKQRVKDEAKQGKGQYSISEDKALYNYIKDALSGILPKKSFYKINEKISNRLAEDIEKIVGFSVENYSNEITPDNIRHIEKQHGTNGKRDSSMKDHHDLARISFVIDNYEKIVEGKISHEYKNSDGTYAKTVVLQKKINDDFYYVVEAVPDANLKSLHIVSAYKNKKDTFPNVPVSNDPRRYVQDGHRSNVSNPSIPNSSKNVKGQYSFAGENAKTANKLKLSTAKQMLKDGADSETIRKETGWFKGYDGKWRFEINDKDVVINKESDFVRYLNLISKKEKTKEEAKEFFPLAMKYFDDYVNGEIALDKFVKHDLLFDAYPELRDIKLKFIFEEALYAGVYNPETKTIELPKKFLKDESELKISLVHELQHAVQDIEGFTRGASGVYWQMRKDSGEVFLDENGNEISNRDLYERTAGEIEARDAEGRIKMTDKERKNTRPDIDRKDVVFANKELVSASNNAQYSIPSDHNYVYTNGKASFTEERLNNLFDEHSLGDGKRAEHSNAYVGYISPEDFVSLTSNKTIRGRVEEEAYVLNEEELRNETETPFIEYDPASGEVVGHEGRHRMVALKADGITKVAVLLKPSTDSFERRTVQDISLTGQNFAEGRAVGKVTVKTAVPLSEKYREKAIQKFAQNPDADVRYSIPNVDTQGNTLSKEQREYFKDSKAVDENGNLLVLYHGTDKGGFTVFDPRFSDDKTSIFLTDSVENANSYIENEKHHDKDIKLPSKKPNALKWIEGDPSKAGNQKGLYKVYANLKNPLIVDCNGALWSNIPYGDNQNYQISFTTQGNNVEVTVKELKGNTAQTQTFSKESVLNGETEQYFTDLFNAEQGSEIAEKLRRRARHAKAQVISNFAWDGSKVAKSYKTRDITKLAKEQGYDGVVFKNVRDHGGSLLENNVLADKTANVVVAFSSNQIKDVNNKTPTEHKDIRYSIPDVGIKQQLKENLEKLNSMEIVATLNEQKSFTSKQNVAEWALSKFEKIGFKVYRNDFGEIILDKKRIKKGLSYLKTNEERLALALLPDVLSKGIEIGSHSNHKGRNYNTFTFAAPVSINGQRGNMAAVVRREDKNYYKVHRLVMPDGSQFVLDEKRDTAETAGGVDNNSGLSPTDNVSKISISDSNEKVKQFSIPDIARGKTAPELLQMANNGEITSDDALKVLAEQHGTMPKGENPKVDVDVPNKVSDKRGVRRFARTVLESGHLTEGMSEDAKREILNGALNYKITSSKMAAEIAQKRVKKDINSAIQEWEGLIASGRIPTSYEIALGEILMVEAAKAGHDNDVALYLAELAALGTQLGQGIQALSLLKRLTGVGQLHYVSRVIAQMNEDLKRRYGDKYTDVLELDPHLEKILAQSTNPAEIESVIDDILTDVARQMPSTWLDKFNAWRYLAMLGNTRTHIRNFLGNLVFLPAIRIKDAAAAIAERIFIKDVSNRTKVFKVSKNYREFAKADFENVKELITSGGKMNPSDKVQDRRKIFTSKAFAWLEKARKINFDLLEKEDLIFLKSHYIHALGSIMQARGLDVNSITEQELNNVREYAINEAKKATYRDFSFFADWLNKAAHPTKEGKPVKDVVTKGASLLIEGTFPFKKTPINVLKRGVEYSPVGIATTIGNAIIAKIRGEYSGAEFIDGFAAGMTGTMILGFGILLQSLGWITGGLGYDDEDALERLAGAQPYAINFGEMARDLGIDVDGDDLTYTIDWMAPASLPLLIGAELSKASKKGEGLNILDALTTIAEPMTELSFLQGVNDIIEGVAYSGEDGLGVTGEVVTNLASSYISQYFPTLAGQIARTFDDTRRTNFIDKDSAFPKSIQTTYQKVLGKIPYFENKKVPYIDAWGRTEVNDNILLRAFENFISPGYVSTVKDDKVNGELAKIFVDTGESSVIPKRAKTSFEVDGKTVNLSADEYVQYATDKGQYSRQYLEEVMSNSMYQGLPSEGKAAVISDLYSYANAKAKSNVSDYDYTTNNYYKTAAKLEAAGISPASYYIAREAMSKENADKDGSGTVSSSEKKKALKEAGFNSKDINTILNINKK